MENSESLRLRRILKCIIPQQIQHLVWRGSYYIQNNWLRTLVGCQTSKRVIALTFDDGPNQNATHQILDILNFYKVKATFFLLGRNIVNYPETARCIVGTGHCIGNHTYNHPYLVKQSPNFITQELSSCQQAIKELVGVKTKIMRPPYGAQDLLSYTTTRLLGFTTVHWSVSGDDYLGDKAHTVAQRILANIQPGNIVLLHDGWEPPPNQVEWRPEYSVFQDRSSTIGTLPLIIEPLKNLDYQFITIPEMVRLGHLIHRNWNSMY
jgi:peptidoglycan/xylan/chitin deacetylase (PgdA/CDA1 family)